MPIWVRNALSPVTPDAWGCNHALFITELLRVAGYTYNSDNGDLAWTDNVFVNEPGGVNGFEVEAASPRVIYDPAGRFTQAMLDAEACISLLATNEENRSLWRIVELIDANHVRVDEWGENPDAWTDETGIPGRIFRLNYNRFSNDAWMLLDAPSPSNLQARIHHDTTSWIGLLARPAGQAADPTEIGSETTALDNYYTNRVRAQMYADGPNVFICWIDQDGTADVMAWGELEVDDPVADPNPGFVLWHDDTQNVACDEYELYMVDHTGVQTRCYIDALKRDWEQDVDNNFGTSLRRRLVNNGTILMRKPNVVMWGTPKYPRGKLPDFFAQSSIEFEQERPLDRAGDWLMWRAGTAIHRNGPDDPVPVRPPAS